LRKLGGGCLKQYLTGRGRGRREVLENKTEKGGIFTCSGQKGESEPKKEDMYNEKLKDEKGFS